MKPDYKLVAKAKYIHANADLASEIWHEVYKRYYPAKQLDTLVETLQSADAIEADIDNDVNYFLVVLGGKTIGPSTGARHWAGISWLPASVWPGVRAGAACTARCTPSACRCCSSSRPRATACWAPPRQKLRAFPCS